MAFEIFTSPFVVNILLPFVLVFAVVYAILEKTNILGNRASNAIVAVVVALIFIGVPAVVGVAQKIIPVVALIVVILLCYLLVFGFVGINVQSNQGLKIATGVILGIVFIGAILWATGVFSKLSGKINTEVITYIVMFLIIGGVIAAVIAAKGTPSGTP